MSRLRPSADGQRAQVYICRMIIMLALHRRHACETNSRLTLSGQFRQGRARTCLVSACTICLLSWTSSRRPCVLCPTKTSSGYAIKFICTEETIQQLNLSFNSRCSQMVSGCTFLDLYNQYLGITTAAKKYTYKQFLDHLHQHFPEITKSRQTQFTQCSLCNTLHSLRAKPNISSANEKRLTRAFNNTFSTCSCNDNYTQNVSTSA